ncbi:alpha/beta fold hydrolase [Mycetocola miduiensis]|uniref:Pimeloyl-ACP methyl ester carboxylesterase n=1 Tax=Mycetocola miduiensis TaxID=995034 RepID=A0A1I4ZN59_9MICO|nr:alpha/beta hydrolase [Mycetocola miduiensis]SFN51419.1 Pimeloyl-ACP methyl ester carboxylesterase [Mycetocola miduiensis]
MGDSWRADFAVRDGKISPVDEGSESSGADFTLAAADRVWEGLCADRPAAGEHSIVYLVRTGVVELSGDSLAYDRSVQIVRALLDAAREASSHAKIGKPLRAVGSYHRVSTSLGTSDIYVERAGSGVPLLTFATAGSDTSQWHGVMTHSDLTDRFELITADLPWHGRSSPSWGEPVGSYQLTPETYTEYIVAICDELGLDRPVLLGVSMGGAAVVHAVATRPGLFAGAVACQAGPSVQARANEHLRGTRVNPALFIPEWTYGLMNPASPEEFKQRVWWGYSSGGFGLYAADIDSYLSWNLDLVEHLLTAESPHIAVLSGAFDTSVPPERSRELASRISNSSFELMPELGHFPHAENPAAFVPYLEAALARVLDSGRGVQG